MWPRSESSPSEQSIIAVAPASDATTPCPYGGSGTRCARTTRSRGAEAASEHGQTCGGPAEASTERDHVAGLRAQAQHGAASLKFAEHRHHDADHGRAGDISTHEGGSGQLAFLADASGALHDPGSLQIGRRREADHDADRAGTHRLQVGDAGRHRLAAHDREGLTRRA